MGETKWTLVGGANSHCFNGRVMDADGECVAFVDINGKSTPMIIAAPELYEALKGLVSYAEAVRHTAGMGKNQMERLERAKAALAKARGEQS